MREGTPAGFDARLSYSTRDLVALLRLSKDVQQAWYSHLRLCSEDFPRSGVDVARIGAHFAIHGKDVIPTIRDAQAEK